MSSRKIMYLVIALLIIGGMFAYQYWNFHWLPEAVDQPYDLSLRQTDGVKHTIKLADLQGAGVPRDNIPAIDDPQFESVGAADIYLKDDGYGLDLEIGGEHRFYPYQILVWHEIVNDEFNGQPILVTYCPLCHSGLVFEREINDQVYDFGTSGRLWNNNLVMYDRLTQTMWSQILGQGIVGQLAGTKLPIIPTQVMTWQAWKTAYPDGQVLTRDTGAERDYTRDPYSDYYKTTEVKFTVTNTDARLGVKEEILGILTPGVPNAYLKTAMKEEKNSQKAVGGQELKIIYNEETDTASAFLDDQPIAVIPAFWFCWAAAYPQTNLHLP